MERWADGWMDGKMDRQMDEWMDGWMVEMNGLEKTTTTKQHSEMLKFICQLSN